MHIGVGGIGEAGVISVLVLATTFLKEKRAARSQYAGYSFGVMLAFFASAFFYRAALPTGERRTA